MTYMEKIQVYLGKEELAALRKAAAKLGADAVVVVSDSTQVTGAYVTGPWYGRSIERVVGRIVIAVAIKYQ